MMEMLNQFNLIVAFSDLVIKSFLMLTFAAVVLRFIPLSASKLRYQLLLLTFGLSLLLPVQSFIPHAKIQLSAFPKNIDTEIQPAYLESFNQVPAIMDDRPFSSVPQLATPMGISSEFSLWLILTIVCWFMITLSLILKSWMEFINWKRWVFAYHQRNWREWKKISREVAETLGLSHYPPIISSHAVKSPLTFGWRYPLVVLPAAAVHWSEERVRVVLLHEGVHIKRRDYFFSNLVQLVLALYWFNPLAWLLARQARLECERSCDEEVVRLGIDRINYAGELLAMAKQSASDVPSNKANIGLAVAQQSMLYQRFHTLLSDGPAFTLPSLPFKSSILGIALLFYFLQIQTSLPYLFSTEQALIHQIKKGESQQTQQLLMALVDREAKTAGEEILPLLNSKSPALRAMAAWALGKLRSEEAVYPLTRQIADQNDEVKEYVLLSLAEFGYSNTFYTIVPLLEHPNAEVRKAALWALSQIGCLPAFYHTSQHLADADPSVRQLASTLLNNWKRDKLFNWMSAYLQRPKVPPLCTESLDGVIRLEKVNQLAQCLAPNSPAIQEELKSILNHPVNNSQLEQLKTIFSKL